MRVTAVYFSPTGNTKKSTEVMAAAITEQYDVIDLTRFENREMKHDFGQDELVIFGMPVYAGRIPMAAAPRLDGLTGNNTPCILVATYGNRHYDDALAEMEDIAKAHGFQVIGAAAVIGRHTYGEIQVDRPNAEDFAAYTEFVKKAVDNLAEGKGMVSVIPGRISCIVGTQRKNGYRPGIFADQIKHRTHTRIMQNKCPVAFDRHSLCAANRFVVCHKQFTARPIQVRFHLNTSYIGIYFASDKLCHSMA